MPNVYSGQRGKKNNEDSSNFNKKIKLDDVIPL